MISPFLFVRWRKEKERGEAEHDEQAYFLRMWRCVTLVVVNGLSRCISCRDKVLLSGVTI